MPAEDIVDTGRLNSELEDKILPFRPIYGFAVTHVLGLTELCTYQIDQINV